LPGQRDLISKGGSILLTSVLIILVLLFIGAIPAWRYSRRWGYGRTGFLGLILVVLLVPWLLGVIG